MKKLTVLLFVSLPLVLCAQTSAYTVNSYLEEGNKAPNTHYIGEAWLHSVLRTDSDENYNITKATFKANSTLDWHKHTAQQVIIIVAGEGYYQERGKEPIRIKEGDVVTCAPDTEHWHASSKESDVTYLAIYNGTTIWTEVLSQEAYDVVGEKLANN